MIRREKDISNSKKTLKTTNEKQNSCEDTSKIYHDKM